MSQLESGIFVQSEVEHAITNTPPKTNDLKSCTLSAHLTVVTVAYRI